MRLSVGEMKRDRAKLKITLVTSEKSNAIMKKLSSLFPLITLTLLGSTEMARCHEASLPVNANTQSVTSEVLASGYPNDAPGRILELVSITIPAGANLPRHIHPGMQTGRVEFGTLTYTIVKGSAKLIRADGTEEIVRSGQTTLLKVGDSLSEPGGTVHSAKNETASPVIILSASLFDVKQPRATLIDSESSRR